MEIAATTLVADLAAHHPRLIPVLERHGLDYCCGGRRPLAEAAAARGLDLAGLVSELADAATAPAGDERDWTEAPLAELTAYIVDRYHGDLRRELPRLEALAAKVLAAHGDRHGAALAPLARVFAGLHAELIDHMAKEEGILFPYLEQLAAGIEAEACFGTVRGPISVMEHEHESAAAALVRLRELTGGYAPPADACGSFRALYAGLAQLEADLHRHIHLENNVLHPRGEALERERRTVAVG